MDQSPLVTAVVHVTGAKLRFTAIRVTLAFGGEQVVVFPTLIQTVDAGLGQALTGPL